MEIPISLRDVLDSFRQTRKELQSKIAILVVGEEVARMHALARLLTPPAHLDEIFDFFVLEKEELPQGLVKKALPSDIILVVLEASKVFARKNVFLTTFISELGKPFLLVLLDEEKSFQREEMFERIEEAYKIGPTKVVLTPLKEEARLDELAEKIVSLVGKKEVALASKIPLLRQAAAGKVIRKTAMENAIIGGITILPGSDMPILTLNQMKMCLKIAAIYGQTIDLNRLRELLAVLGGGFTFRAVARQLLDFLPGPGWLLKGGVAYSGTMAMGKAAIKYFTSGLGYLTTSDLRQILKNKENKENKDSRINGDSKRS